MLGSFLSEFFTQSVEGMTSMGPVTKGAFVLVAVGIMFVGIGQILSGTANVVIAAKTRDLVGEEVEDESDKQQTDEL